MQKHNYQTKRNIFNFRCEKCDHVFKVEKTIKITSSKCPKCCNVVVNEITNGTIKKKNYPAQYIGKKKLCEACMSIYFDSDSSKRICDGCKEKNIPFGTVILPKNLSKFQKKKIDYSKKMNRLIKSSKDNFDELLDNARIFGFSDEDLSEFGKYIVKYMTNMNILLDKNIKRYNGKD